MKKVFFTMGTKGGAGKSKITTGFLPLAILHNAYRKKKKIGDVDIKLFLVDNNNSNDLELKNGSLVSINGKLKTDSNNIIRNLKEDIQEFVLEDENEEHYILVDIGGGDDTIRVLQEMSKLAIKNDIAIIVPFFLENEFILSMKQTVDLLHSTQSRTSSTPPDIYIVANKINKDVEVEARENEMELMEYIKNYIKNALGEVEYDSLEDRISGLTMLKDFSDVFGRLDDEKIMVDYIDNFVFNDTTYETARLELQKKYKEGNHSKEWLREEAEEIDLAWDCLSVFDESVGFIEDVENLKKK